MPENSINCLKQAPKVAASPFKPSGWNDTQEGDDRTVRRELRQVLKKFNLPLTGPLFDNAYRYVRENY